MVEPADVLLVDDGVLAGRGDELEDPALGQEAVLDLERPADAAVGADRALEKVDVLEEPALDLVEDAHGVLGCPRRPRPGGCLRPRVSPPESDQPMPRPLKSVSGKRWRMRASSSLLRRALRIWGKMSRIEMAPSR